MIDINELTELCSGLGCKIIPNCPLSAYVTFRTGGNCRALISINSPESAMEILKYLRSRNIKYFILGNGSNVIPADEGFDGVILLLKSDFSGISVIGNKIKCQSGALLSTVCMSAQRAGLSGIENLYGIPGTIGGALYMNAGAYGTEIADVIVSAEYIGENGSLCNIVRDDMELSYRHSIFSGKNFLITSVTLELSTGEPEEIRRNMSECLNKRQSKQPLEFPSAGSTFKRPQGSYASLLIEKCGLKGLSCGGAQVSEKHSGFIINKGNATCADVLELCGKVQEVVREKTGYSLELEPVILK
ncbi:MAG: UDP-N-acetylmuramate dehydrogenase [Muribaculaceae bacterium]|nr:UDP-N-acetylmuramate dehydrogenase [Alistipes senegalensis]MCM1473650.1 UDP-N-acetylmuramate dehydrogenase [Muribaculaceae bacterium]